MGVPSAATDIEVSPQLPDMYAEPLNTIVVPYGDQRIVALGYDYILDVTRAIRSSHGPGILPAARVPTYELYGF